MSASRSIPVNTRSASAVVPRTVRNRRTRRPSVSRPRSTVSSQEPRLRRRTLPRVENPPASRHRRNRAIRTTILWCASRQMCPTHDAPSQHPAKAPTLRNGNGRRLPKPPNPRRGQPGGVRAYLADAIHDVRYSNELASVTRFILVIHHIIVLRMQQQERSAASTSARAGITPPVVSPNRVLN